MSEQYNWHYTLLLHLLSLLSDLNQKRKKDESNKTLSKNKMLIFPSGVYPKIFIKVLHCLKPEIPNVCMFLVHTEYVCCNLEMKRSGDSFIIYALNGSQSYINLILIGFKIKLYNAWHCSLKGQENSEIFLLSMNVAALQFQSFVMCWFSKPDEKCLSYMTGLLYAIFFVC